ncbi:uncharacterized protein TNCV_1391701 [Trichonephila clavipes]|nr:uncharacterized protein TNCV_1391701 [Trichonephila clavipes]
MYLNSKKLEQLENQHAEIDKRWVEIINHFKSEHIPYENLVILVEFTLGCTGANAAVERVFSIGNDFGQMRNQDNTRPHVACTTQKLKKCTRGRIQWTTLEHPPNSPNLAPSYCHLLGPLKEMLGGFVKGILETGSVMDKCVQMWTRNYGALGQTARVCFGVLCANKKKEEAKTDFEGGRKRRGDPKGEVEEKEKESPGEGTVGGRRKDGKERERVRRRKERKKRKKRVGRESEARLEWRKRAESGNWSEKDDERRWR